MRNPSTLPVPEKVHFFIHTMSHCFRNNFVSVLHKQNIFQIFVSEFSIEAVVGRWHHNNGAEVTCTKISEFEVDCQFRGSMNNMDPLTNITWDGTKYLWNGADFTTTPTIRLNSAGVREIDWNNGNKWTEHSKY